MLIKWSRKGLLLDYRCPMWPVSKANGVVFVGGIFLLFPLSLLLAHFYLLIRLSDSISQHARTAGERNPIPRVRDKKIS